MERTIIENDDFDERVKNPITHYWFMIFLVPVLLSAIPICTSNYRATYPDPQTLSAISINTDKSWQRISGVLELIFLEIIPYFIALAFVTYYISKIYFRIREIEKEIIINREIRKHVQGTLLFPISLAIIWLPIIITRIISFFDKSVYQPSSALNMDPVDFAFSVCSQSLVTF